MLADLRSDDFAGLVNERFHVHAGAGVPLDAELVEVTDLEPPRAAEPGRADPFSILLRVTGDAPLPQRIYEVEHPRLGTLSLFLVPIGREDGSFLYEAVFN
jgi:hypothetical protein